MVAAAPCLECGKDSTLKCPTCIKLALPASPFCSQACFKVAWPSHRLLHTPASYNPFPHFSFTGSLRPVYPLSQPRLVPANIMRPDYADDGKPKSEIAIRGQTQIQVLTPDEIAHMRTVCRVKRWKIITCILYFSIIKTNLFNIDF